MFLLAFMLLTAEPLGVSDVAPGALLATLFWRTLQLIGTWYMSREMHSASAAYGYFAIVVTLLSWLYLGAQLACGTTRTGSFTMSCGSRMAAPSRCGCARWSG
ncbi:MAG: YihY/virulence factor BrkB family protein [Streptosporangiaceae bacterium]|nr:YihY/virulence factor BrkB family protein [Streptosporangiaceae bacterium]